MTGDTLRAQAATADREADAIFDQMSAASMRDRFGSRPLIPHGFEDSAERASDLRRRARSLRAEADEMRPAIVTTAPSRPPTPAPVPPVREAAPATPIAPVETAATVAARVLASESVAASCVAPLTRAAAAETLDDVVARILES